MIVLYGVLIVAVMVLIVYAIGAFEDLKRQNALLQNAAEESAIAMSNCLNWVDDVAKMEPLAALKEVQLYSRKRNEYEAE